MRDVAPVVKQGRCTVCGKHSVFVTRRLPPRGLHGGLRCLRCGARSRNRHVAIAIVEALADRGVGSLADLRTRDDIRVLNAGHGSAIAHQLDGLAHVDNTGYWEDVTPGDERDGVRCEDLTALSYDDASLDLVISEDVLEHIPDTAAALGELHRVLKPGGAHVFTVPYHPDRPGKALFDMIDGEPRLHEPIEYHSDPIQGRIPAYHRFGYGLVEQLRAAGFRSRLLISNYRDLRAHAIADATTFITHRRR